MMRVGVPTLGDSLGDSIGFCWLFGLLRRLEGKGVHGTSARFRSDVGVAFDHLSAAPSKDRELHRLGYSAFAPLH